jgi:hypothetical protein
MICFFIALALLKRAKYGTLIFIYFTEPSCVTIQSTHLSDLELFELDHLLNETLRRGGWYCYEPLQTGATNPLPLLLPSP